MTDRAYMKRVLFLATKGRGKVAPNPLVAAIIVKEAGILAEGWHASYGDSHAEVVALTRAGPEARGATLYTNLEPCSCTWEGKHHPPCVDAIIAAGIRHVYISHIDPHPLVNGRGVQRLRNAGVSVQVGICEEEARILNEVYLYNLSEKKLFIHLKYAQSLDGIMATSTGDSRWISSKKARRHAHLLRASYDGVLVGSKTLRHDDPELTVRHIRGTNPHRFVLDASLHISEATKFVQLAKDGKSTICTTVQQGHSVYAQRLREWGVHVVALEETEKGIISLKGLLEYLYKEGIRSLLVEGGAKVISEFFHQNLWNKMTLYIAPIILGTGKSPNEGIIFDTIAQARRMPASWRRFHDTMSVELYNK